MLCYCVWEFAFEDAYAVGRAREGAVCNMHCVLFVPTIYNRMQPMKSEPPTPTRDPDNQFRKNIRLPKSYQKHQFTKSVWGWGRGFLFHRWVCKVSRTRRCGSEVREQGTLREPSGSGNSANEMYRWLYHTAKIICMCVCIYIYIYIYIYRERERCAYIYIYTHNELGNALLLHYTRVS